MRRFALFSKQTFILLTLLPLFFACSSSERERPLRLIPRPKSILFKDGAFTLEERDRPVPDVPSEEMGKLSDYLLTTELGVARSKEELRKSRFRVSKRRDLPGISSEEGYHLIVDKSGITLEAPSYSGLFYGLQTLLRLKGQGHEIPFVEVTDEPRFPYRGLMLDVSRHFFPMKTIERQIDVMAELKLNRLHLHLTDAAGWRLQVESYPRLTSFAAWRDGAKWKEWWDGERRYLEEGTPGAYGGFYTKDEIRHLVAYAAERGITIIPEIEMPGHSEEVLTAYPELSCTHEPYKEADFCPGNEETFRFLEAVLTEVMELFPSEYIHIGGDEAGKRSWHSCPLCLKRMKEEHLASVDELQSYLIHRVERFLQAHGRKVIGWDEIIDGGLSGGETVMSWRGEEGALRAARNGNDAIMAPGAFCYFDQYQDAPLVEPEAIGGYLPPEKVYTYDPIPEGLSQEESAHIIGVQANLWTEYVPTPDHLEYMLYPRLFALSEVAWSPAEARDYDSFRPAALRLSGELQERGYHTFDLSKEKGERKAKREGGTHRAMGKTVSYQTPYNDKYSAGGDSALTDGKRGGWTYTDGQWQGFIGKGFAIVVDLGGEQSVTSISMDFLQVSNPEIYLPKEVKYLVSKDGKTYTEVTTLSNDTDPDIPYLIKAYKWEASKVVPALRARFVRCEAYTIPKGGWLFTDEIVIR